MRCPRCGSELVFASGRLGVCAACGVDLRRTSLRYVLLLLVLDSVATVLLIYALLADRGFLGPAIGLMVLGAILLPSAIQHYRAVASHGKVSPS